MQWMEDPMAGEHALPVKRQPLAPLRFNTCGAVAAGKSSIVARLCRECELGPDAATAGEPGSSAHADVAYRHFSSQLREFIVADPPGGENDTGRLVVGASTASAALVVVDAEKGIVNQTRRHSYLCTQLGLRQLIVGVNKMDRVDYDQAIFERIRAEYLEFAAGLGLQSSVCIPISALRGDNVIEPGDRMPWYEGMSLLAALETEELSERAERRPFRLPVQWSARTGGNLVEVAGYVPSGSIRKGGAVLVLPCGKRSAVRGIRGVEGELAEAVAGQSITLELDGACDVQRGDLITNVETPALVADRFRCTLLWLHEEPMFPGRPYSMKIGTRAVLATVTEVRHRVDVNTLAQLAAKQLDANDIAVCNLQTDEPIAFDAYSSDQRETGGFILIDRATNHTVAAGMLSFALWRSHNVHWQLLDINKQARSQLNGQKPCVLWFTGLSGAGKSTIANLLEKRLASLGRHTYLLDGDNVRHGLNSDLGFTAADRVENIRRVTEVAKLMVDAGLIVLVSFIAPFQAERRRARESFEPGEFLEVYVDTPLEEAERRDPKGLYQKARQGLLKNFTGIDSPYEPPEKPEVHIRTLEHAAEDAAELLLNGLLRAGRLDSPSATRGR
jgi:bifunctional enzyme CysN/CysC